MYQLNGLSGDDSSVFTSYWNSVKSSISKIYALGSQILTGQNRLADMRTRAIAANATGLVAEIDQQRTVWDTMQTRWETTRQYIDKYLPSWKQAEFDVASAAASYHVPISTTYVPPSVNGLGAIPIVLGGLALAALAYVATSGLSLIKDYAFQSTVLTSLEKKLITVEQAKSLVTTKVPTAITEFSGSLGKYVGIGAAMLAAVYVLPMLLKKRKTAQ